MRLKGDDYAALAKQVEEAVTSSGPLVRLIAASDQVQAASVARPRTRTCAPACTAHPTHLHEHPRTQPRTVHMPQMWHNGCLTE